MMTDREIDLLAQRICFYAKQDNELLGKIADMVKKAEKPVKKLISLNDAAKMIGISRWQLYRIKDDVTGKPQFSYVKTGDSQSSPIKFNAATIVEEYERYLASKKSENRIVRLEPTKIAAGA